jgi:hypothetical protein
MGNVSEGRQSGFSLSRLTNQLVFAVGFECSEREARGLFESLKAGTYGTPEFPEGGFVAEGGGAL